MKKRKNYLINIKEKDLSKDRVWGYAYMNQNLIELEATMRKKRRLRTLCHELAHKAFPLASERDIERAEKILAFNLWEQNYRKVDQ